MHPIPNTSALTISDTFLISRYIKIEKVFRSVFADSVCETEMANYMRVLRVVLELRVFLRSFNFNGFIYCIIVQTCTMVEKYLKCVFWKALIYLSQKNLSMNRNIRFKKELWVVFWYDSIHFGLIKVSNNHSPSFPFSPFLKFDALICKKFGNITKIFSTTNVVWKEWLLKFLLLKLI